MLTAEGIPTPTAYAISQGRNPANKNANLNRWDDRTVSGILGKAEYCGHTVNFKTRKKSYKNKKIVRNPQEEWLIFENTPEPIVTQEQFDLVQELRKHKRRPTKHEEVNPFSCICYCADCGKKMYLCQATSVSELTSYIKMAEQKSSDVTAFIQVVQKYERITELTPEIMHELIEKIVVHAPDKSSGHRTQEIEIHLSFQCRRSYCCR